MTNLYRLVSPEKLELYDLKRNGKLHFQKTIAPSNFNFKKIRLLVLSAYFINWDTTRIENTAYQPSGNVNLFASKSVFGKHNLITTAPFRNMSPGFWAQAWAPKDKLLLVLKNISKKAQVYAESITISSSDNSVFWLSGPVILNSQGETGFAVRHSTKVVGEAIVTNLDGFEFTPRAEFNLFSRRKPYALMLAGLAFLASIAFAWEFSVKDTIKNIREPKVVFNNGMRGLRLMDTTQGFVPTGAAEQITFDHRTQETFLTFLSKENAQKFFQLVSNSPESIRNWDISIKGDTVIFKESGDQ
jgi:hypothetical protein